MFYYISYVKTGEDLRMESHEVINISPIEWVRQTNLNYSGGPYILLNQFEITEAEYLANKNILV